MRKPFYVSKKKCWYVKDEAGRFVRFDADEAEAYRIWQQMVEAATSLNHPKVSVRAIVEAWLNEFENQLSATRYAAIGGFLGQFVDFVGNKSACGVTNSLLLKWMREPKQNRLPVDKEPKPPAVWSQWTQRAAGSAIKRVFRWAHEQGYINRNPVASLKLKTPRSRQRIVTPQEHALLVASLRKHENGKAFALYLIASHCGARPQQLRTVVAHNVQMNGAAWVFDEHKTVETTGKPLVVYLSPCLQTITRILAAQRPTGPLFLQENGRQWKKDTITQKMRRIREKLGLGDEIVVYCYRHTFATDALLADVPIATVAALLGHVDTKMVSQVYGHLDQHAQHSCYTFEINLSRIPHAMHECFPLTLKRLKWSPYWALPHLHSRFN